MAAKDERKELWVGWTHDALTGYSAPENDDDEPEDVANDMADVACSYADFMLEEYDRRFDGKGERGASRRRKRSKKDDDEEEEAD